MTCTPFTATAATSPAMAQRAWISGLDTWRAAVDGAPSITATRDLLKAESHTPRLPGRHWRPGSRCPAQRVRTGVPSASPAKGSPLPSPPPPARRWDPGPD